MAKSVYGQDKREVRTRFGMSRRTDTKVPGRKTIVSTAMVFIAEESRLLAWAMLLESAATSISVRLSFCCMKL